MDDALAQQTNANCYIHGLFVYIKTLEKHLKHIEQVVKLIAVVGLKAHPSKCVFGAQEVPYLEHMLSAHAIRN